MAESGTKNPSKEISETKIVDSAAFVKRQMQTVTVQTPLTPWTMSWRWAAVWRDHSSRNNGHS